MTVPRSLLHNFRGLPVRRTCSAPTAYATRAFHTSPASHDLVAPPDPVSHMRPIIYDDPPTEVPEGTYVRHPYSLSEFQFQEGSTGALSLGDNELQFKISRQQLDALHQNFWLDVSTSQP